MVYSILIVVALIVGKLFGQESDAISFVSGFAFGIGGVAAVKSIRFSKTLKDQEKLKQMYIKEHDERLQEIASKVGVAGLNIGVSCMALGMLVAIFFNMTVFYTLLAATLFMVALKLILGWYYNKKI